jgi:hypothetical protein
MVSPLTGYYHSQSCLQLWFLRIFYDFLPQNTEYDLR